MAERDAAWRAHEWPRDRMLNFEWIQDKQCPAEHVYSSFVQASLLRWQRSNEAWRKLECTCSAGALRTNAPASP